MMNVSEEIKEKIMIHQNEVLDCLIVEDLFDSNYGDNFKLNISVADTDK